MNVLIVEPDTRQRLLVEKVMRLRGENVFSVGEHGAALDICKANSIDMAVIDLDANPVESIGLVRHIRSLDPGNERITYILVGTGKGDVSDVLDILEAGANEFIDKPFDRAALEAKALLGRRLEHASDAIGVLTEEHKAILRVTGILEYISDKVSEKRVPKKLLDWVTSTSFLLDSDIHHRKEEHFMVSFLDSALKAEAREGNSTVFSRSSMKTVEDEHVELMSMKREIQANIGRYSLGQTPERVGDLRESIGRYVRLLKDHMHREERFLFPASRPLFTEGENVRLLGEFQKVEAEVGFDKIDSRLRTLLAAEKLVKRNLEMRRG